MDLKLQDIIDGLKAIPWEWFIDAARALEDLKHDLMCMKADLFIEGSCKTCKHCCKSKDEEPCKSCNWDDELGNSCWVWHGYGASGIMTYDMVKDMLEDAGLGESDEWESGQDDGMQ